MYNGGNRADLMRRQWKGGVKRGLVSNDGRESSNKERNKLLLLLCALL